VQKTEEARHTVESECSDVTVPALEPILPLSFDSLDTIIHRYRFIEIQISRAISPQINQELIDHDDGIEGIIIERSIMLRSLGRCVGGLPSYYNVYIQKDIQNCSFRSDVELTTGLDVFHCFCDKLKPTKFTVGLSTISLGGHTGGSNMLYILRGETRTNNVLMSYNKLVLGLQTSRMPVNPMTLVGPKTFGAKIENRMKLGRKLKFSLAIGLCVGTGQGIKKTQNANSFQGDIIKKIDKSNTLTLTGSLMRLGNETTTRVGVGHQQNVTPETTLTTRIKYVNKESGTFNVKLASLDYPELVWGLLIHVIGAILVLLRSHIEVY